MILQLTQTPLMLAAVKWARTHPEPGVRLRVERPIRRRNASGARAIAGRNTPALPPCVAAGASEANDNASLPSAGQIASAVAAAIAPWLLNARAEFVTEQNSAVLIGENWTWVKRRARTLGVPIIHAGQKRLISRQAFVEALNSQAARSEKREASIESHRPLTEAEATAAVLRALGR